MPPISALMRALEKAAVSFVATGNLQTWRLDILDGIWVVESVPARQQIISGRIVSMMVTVDRDCIVNGEFA